MHYIEIQTAENSRLLGWVRIYGDSDFDRAVRWGDRLVSGVSPAPFIRITDSDGERVGAWYPSGYEAVKA